MLIDSARRARLKIYFDILSLCKGGPCKKTKIMQKCNLDYSQLQMYLEFLVGFKFLIKADGGYQVSDKGQEYVKAFQFLEPYLTQIFELAPPTYSEIQMAVLKRSQKHLFPVKEAQNSPKTSLTWIKRDPEHNAH